MRKLYGVYQVAGRENTLQLVRDAFASHAEAMDFIRGYARGKFVILEYYEQ